MNLAFLSEGIRGITGLSFLTLAGCTALNEVILPSLAPEPFNEIQIEGELTPAEQNVNWQDSIDTGLALSGGGMRSAYYSIGAMKALYDAGLLGQEIDVISAVSGGSYAAYWTYANQRAADVENNYPVDSVFGSASFDNEHFSNNVCRRLADANFVTTGAMVRSVITGQSRELYTQRLRSVFGARDHWQLQMHELLPWVERRDWPYPIINTTINRPEPTGWEDGLFEFTAAGTRGLLRGEQVWPTEQSITFLKAIATSGAALAPFLAREIEEISDRPDGRVAVMHDGGPSENLGAIALIRRGLPRVIVIDAEHDPDYSFGAYVNLKDRLSRWGATLVIPGIESHLSENDGDSPEESSFHGDVIWRDRGGAPQITRISYVKMSLPSRELETMRREITDNSARQEYVTYFESLSTIDRSDGTVACDSLEAPTLPNELGRFFSYAVAIYEQDWNDSLRARMLRSGFLGLNFPQYSTGDQSMYRDQALAFIALGYLQTMKFLEGAS